MKCRLFISYIIFLVCAWNINPCAYAQSHKEYIDTIPTPTKGDDVKANEYFFEALKAKMHDDDGKALECFEKFAELKPDVPAVYNELASLYTEQKKIDKAEETIKKAIALNGNNVWYKEQYAGILAMRSKFADAGKVMSELVATNPGDKTFLKQTVDFYEQAGNLTEALKYVNIALEGDDGDEEILIHKAQLLVALNEPDQAAEVMKKLISKDNRNGRYYKILGEIYEKNKEPAKALEVYKEGQKIIPTDPTLLMGIAGYYMKSGDTGTYKKYLRETIVNEQLDAETQLELLDAFIQTMNSDSEVLNNATPIIGEIVRQHPSDPAALATYGDFLYRENQKEKAIISYKKSLQIAPSNFNLWIRFLGIITDREDADTLIKYSEKIIRLFPNQSLAHYYNGIGHYNKKEYKAAINSLNRAIDLQPETSPQKLAGIYGFVGEIYNILKDYNNSDKAYDQALHYNPNDESILNNYSYFLSERNTRLSDAETMSAKSLKLRPNEPTYMDTYGWIMYKLGNYTKARDYIEDAIKLAGTNADATLYNHLGNVYYKLDDRLKAVQYWKIAKEMGSDDPQIDKKISEEKLYE